MKKIIPIFLIFLFFLVSCKTTPQSAVETDINVFTSKTFGEIAIFPTFKYLGMKERSENSKAYRKYHVWENPYENKYIMILQMIPKQGKTFPSDINWFSGNPLYVKGMRAAYSSIGGRPHGVMVSLGAEFPPCFILAEEVHLSPKEVVFRILIVPDKMCAEEYEPVMEELDRVAIINSLN